MYHKQHRARKKLCTLECLMVREITSKTATFYEKLGTIFNWKTGSNNIANDNFPSFAKTFNHELLFHQIYKFLKAHKDVAYNSKIPHSSCLCEICKNASLFAKGVNANLKQGCLLLNAHELVEMRACSSSFKDCMVRDCNQFLKPRLSSLEFKEEYAIMYKNCSCGGALRKKPWNFL